MKYKRLNLPNWIKWLNHPIMGEDTRECLETYREILPVFNKDGFYYDRYRNFAWYEFNNQAWTQDKLEETWKFEFDLVKYRRLNKAEIDAIKTLMVYHNCPQILKDVLYQNELNKRLHNTYWEARLFSEKCLKEIVAKRQCI